MAVRESLLTEEAQVKTKRNCSCLLRFSFWHGMVLDFNVQCPELVWSQRLGFQSKLLLVGLFPR